MSGRRCHSSKKRTRPKLWSRLVDRLLIQASGSSLDHSITGLTAVGRAPSPCITSLELRGRGDDLGKNAGFLNETLCYGSKCIYQVVRGTLELHRELLLMASDLDGRMAGDGGRCGSGATWHFSTTSAVAQGKTWAGVTELSHFATNISYENCYRGERSRVAGRS